MNLSGACINRYCILQPVHNKLMLCLQWNSFIFNQSMQGIPVPYFAESLGKSHSFQSSDWSHRRVKPISFLNALQKALSRSTTLEIVIQKALQQSCVICQWQRKSSGKFIPPHSANRNLEKLCHSHFVDTCYELSHTC